MSGSFGGGRDMQFRLLGPVELWDGERRVDLGPMKQRAVLAALLADTGKTVSPEALIDRVWGERPPAQARNVLHTYVARLRGLLGRLGDDPPRLVKQPGGYRFEAGAATVDLHQFRSLAGAAEVAEVAPHDRTGLLRQAIDLWHGEPLEGVRGAWADQCRELWRTEHRDTTVRWAGLEIGQGRGAAAVGSLEPLAEEYPLVEPVIDMLMRALHAAGRDPEALERYERLRRVLADELGVDPGPDLQALHQSILRGEMVAPAVVVAAQIPSGVSGFVGRLAQLARLEEPGEIVILHGMAGAGKTTLAVRWASAAAGRFPDGQLYVDLHGFSASGAVTEPAGALQGFLEALGVPPQRIPLDLRDRAALYRSLLAGRRVLVVLDNARDADQVRPLLPGTPTARTLVTSRNSLAGLIVAHGVRPVILDLLDGAEAVKLVADRIGAGRAAREPDALREMTERCAGLPLALAVLASNIATRPDVPLAILAGELREAGTTLDALASDDPAIDARTVFSWSLRGLSPAGARLFRLLGVQFGNDLSVPAAASLAALPVRQTRRLIQELLGAQLLAEQRPGRYSMHDLLREFAEELAEQHETPADLRAAQVRLLDHYLHVSHEARARMSSLYDPLTLNEPAAGVQLLEIDGYNTARSWFAAEYPILPAAVRRAKALGLPAYAWQLTWVFGKFRQQRGYWRDQLTAGRLALEATVLLGDRVGEARMRHILAITYSRVGRTDLARSLLEEACRIHEELGDLRGQAVIWDALAVLVHGAGENDLAVEYFERAAALSRAVGNRLYESRVLNGIAWVACTTGDYHKAVDYGHQALKAIQSFDNPVGYAATWDTLGYAYHYLGRLDDALDCYDRALDYHGHVGDPYYEALVHLHIGDVQRDKGNAEAARLAWREAERLLAELTHADVADARRRLLELDRRSLETADAA